MRLRVGSIGSDDDDVSSPQPFKLRLPKEITVEEINVDRIDFNTAPPAQTDAIGRVYWDTTYNSPSIGLTSGVNQKMGQTLYKRGRNQTGTQLQKGEVVYISGSHALTELLVARADADTEATSADTVGVAAETIDNNSTGFKHLQRCGRFGPVPVRCRRGDDIDASDPA
jgi:hypothetical protein